MKKLLLALGVATALTGTAFANTETLSTDGAQAPNLTGLVTFSGKIVPETCEVSTPSRELRVNLPTLSLLSLKGQDRGRTPFTITLNNCDGGHAKISLGFTPTADGVNSNGLLVNKASGQAAKGVFIQLTSKDKAVLLHKPVGEQNVEEIALDYQPDETDLEGKFEYDFHFEAEYATEGTPTAGNVGATLPFSIIYK